MFHCSKEQIRLYYHYYTKSIYIFFIMTTENKTDEYIKLRVVGQDNSMKYNEYYSIINQIFSRRSSF